MKHASQGVLNQYGRSQKQLLLPHELKTVSQNEQQFESFKGST